MYMLLFKNIFKLFQLFLGNNIYKNKKTYLFLLLILSSVFAKNENLNIFDSKSDYIIDEAGKILMPVNVLGMVRIPGTYYLDQNVGILTILAASGGALPGADIKDILIYRKKNYIEKINLNDILKEGKDINFTFKPNDTIYIKQSIGSSIISGTPIINIFLSVMNIYLIFDNLNK